MKRSIITTLLVVAGGLSGCTGPLTDRMDATHAEIVDTRHLLVEQKEITTELEKNQRLVSSRDAMMDESLPHWQRVRAAEIFFRELPFIASRYYLGQPRDIDWTAFPSKTQVKLGPIETTVESSLRNVAIFNSDQTIFDIEKDGFHYPVGSVPVSLSVIFDKAIKDAAVAIPAKHLKYRALEASGATYDRSGALVKKELALDYSDAEKIIDYGTVIYGSVIVDESATEADEELEAWEVKRLKPTALSMLVIPPKGTPAEKNFRLPESERIELAKLLLNMVNVLGAQNNSIRIHNPDGSVSDVTFQQRLVDCVRTRLGLSDEAWLPQPAAAAAQPEAPSAQAETQPQG